MNAMAWEHLHQPDLRGRTVVMTGASDGLGREAVVRLVQLDLAELASRSGPALDRDLAHEVTAWARSELAAV